MSSFKSLNYFFSRYWKVPPGHFHKDSPSLCCYQPCMNIPIPCCFCFWYSFLRLKWQGFRLLTRERRTQTNCVSSTYNFSSQFANFSFTLCFPFKWNNWFLALQSGTSRSLYLNLIGQIPVYCQIYFHNLLKHVQTLRSSCPQNTYIVFINFKEENKESNN